MSFIFFFCFKQKTAYEITRRDWSSDVCSSDLADPSHRQSLVGGPRPDEVGRFGDRLIGPLRGSGGGDYRRRGRGRCRLRRGRGTASRSGGGARLDGPERGGEGV